MKVNIKSLPKGYSIVNGKVYRDGGSTTGDQSNYGLVQFPLLDDSPTHGSPFDSVNYSLSPVPREEANLEAEKGETVLTDMNNDGDFELYDIPGKRHHKGGTPLNLPPQSFIYSDTPKMKLSKYELAEMGLNFPTKMTPAKVSKMYQLNNFIGLLDDNHSDKITKDTANYMLDKNKRSLSQLAFLQEAKKEFEDGVPLAAYPYLAEKGIDPIDFSQKVEDISRQEAEQKMLMQLPIEEQLQLLVAKQQLQEQQNRQAQQNELVKQGQMPPSMINEQAPNPQDDMAMQQMNMQGMAPQGMMPPQMPMQGQQAMMPPPQQMQQPMQQPAMAKRGGQISLLNRKRGGSLPRFQKGGYDRMLDNQQKIKVDEATAFNEDPANIIKQNNWEKYQKWFLNYLKGQQNYMQNWVGSDAAYNMWLNSTGSEKEAKFIQNRQLENLDNFDIKLQPERKHSGYYWDPIETNYNFAARSEPYLFSKSAAMRFTPSGFYQPDPDKPFYKPWGRSTGIHEFSHQSDTGQLPWERGGYSRYTDYGGFGSNRIIPTHWLDYIEKNAKDPGADAFWNPDFGFDYFSDPTEVRARINETRYMMNEEGVYDPFKEKLTKKQLQEVIKTGDYHDYNSLDDLLKIFNEDQVLHMINNMANTKEQLSKNQIENEIGDDIPDYARAQYGSELPQFGWGSSLMDWGQGALSVAGMIPGVGIIADAANTAISGGRAAYAGYTGDTEARDKHLANAALNATAMIPGVGQIATATKAGKTVAAATKAKTISKTAGLIGDDVASTAANVGGKYMDKLSDVAKIGDSATETVIGSGQAANLYKKGDFVADEVQGEGKFNKSRQYGEFEDVAQTPEQQLELTEAAQTDNVASISADVAAGDQVASMDATDIMDTQTQPIEETAMQEEEMVNTEEASIDAEEYTPQAESDDEEYSPQSMAAWGYEIPKLQKGGYDAMLDAQVRNQLNIGDDYKEKIKSGPESNTIDAPILPYAPGYGQASMDPFQASLIYDAYKTNIDSINSVYNNNMLSLINAYRDSVEIPNMEQQMMMLGASGMQQIDEDMVEVWKEHIELGGSPPNEPDINYTKAYKEIHGEDSMPTYKNAAKNQGKPNQTITNVYTTPDQKMDDLSSSYINEAIMRKYGQNPYPTEGEDEQSQFMQYLPKQRRAMLDFDDPSSPYYAGTDWTLDNMKYGGDILPKAQRGGSITYNGEEYDKKRLKKLYKKNPALYNEIMESVEGTKGGNRIEDINAMRQDIEATEETTKYLTSGDEDWNQFYEGDSQEAKELRDQRYKNYLEVAAENDLTPISAEDFHKNYVTFQKQNQWMNQNISKEDLDNPGWDRLNEYTPCPEGDTDGCVEINGKYWKQGDKKEANWRYNQAMEEAGMDAFDQDMIKHMQAGYIGGKMMEMSEEELAQLKHEGVGDQTWQGFAISGVDGFFGNTTNRQIEGREEITPGTERQPCANAEEMQAACAEAGGTWTPYNAEDDSGCTCSKPIDVPEKTMIEEKDTPFWLQDELAIGNALDDKLSLKKRYPWSPFYQKPQIDAVFKDPTREIAAIGEMAAQATDAATAFGGGPQRAMAAALAAQGQAMKGIADAVNQVQSDNVTIANNVNTKNAELEYKTQLLNNAEAKSLYDNTVLTDENYDNALRKANAKLTKTMQNAYTNRANTANLNSIYPQFDIDPASGGMINITDPKAFYADSNYQDPKTHLENYTKTIDELKRMKVPEDQWPKYVMPNQNPGQSFAEQNQQAITSGGYQGRMGKEMRLARKRMALRNFFGK
jgi:hypothetical protein